MAITRRKLLGMLTALPFLAIGAGVTLATKTKTKLMPWYTSRVVSERELTWMLAQGWTIRDRNKDGDWSIERYNGMVDVSKLGLSDKT